MNAFSRRAFAGMCPQAFAASAGPKGNAGSGGAYRHLDEFIPRYMRERNTPGLALAVTNRQELLRFRCYGFSDVKARIRVSPDTLFQIGSISKSFAAVAVLKLCEEGKLDLHAPVRRYLPWFRIQSKYPQFTIHHVLCHSSGMPSNRDDLPSSLYQAVALSERETLFTPGARFAYSNIGYQVLGHVIGAVAGMPYPEYLVKRIFEPLGMAATVPSITNGIRTRLATGYPPYYDDRPPHSSHPMAPGTWLEWEAGDGNIAATAGDLAAFLRMLMNGGACPGGRILSPQSYRLMTQRAVPIGSGRFYGYGISMRPVDGHTVLGHSGGMVGYSGIMLYDPDEGLGVVMLSNGAGNPAMVGEYTLRVMRASAARKSLPIPPAQTSVITNAADYNGSYTSIAGKTLTVYAEGQQLFVLHAGERIRLEQRGEDAFYVNHRDFALFLLAFRRENGAVVEATHGGDWYPGARFNGARRFDYPSEWDTLPGHYRSYNPWLSNFRIVLRKGQLWFIHPEGNERGIIQVGAGMFQIGEAQAGEQLRLDSVVSGFAQRANLSGADYYRTFTP